MLTRALCDDRWGCQGDSVQWASGDRQYLVGRANLAKRGGNAEEDSVAREANIRTGKIYRGVNLEGVMMERRLFYGLGRGWAPQRSKRGPLYPAFQGVMVGAGANVK